jgi:AraC-like DNA-binding protein
MSVTGFTKARSMGPVAAAVQRAGGSVARMFRQAELPVSLVDQPDLLIPLRDQLKLVEFAARETGDEALPARLSLQGGVEHLGTFGRHVCSAPQLGIAIARCNDHMGSSLQSATFLRLSRLGRLARWSYSITDDAQIGRQKNEILALGYMLDLLHRYFAVPADVVRAELPGPRVAARASIQDLFGCEIVPGPSAALVFPAEYLDATNRARASLAPLGSEGDLVLPGPADFVAHVEHMIVLGFLERRPLEEWTCRRLHISRRSLQRALASRDTSFKKILRRVLMRHAAELVEGSRVPVTQIALDLGYSDPAHFTRAFVRWFGESPRSWRRKSQRLRPIAGGY